MIFWEWTTTDWIKGAEMVLFTLVIMLYIQAFGSAFKGLIEGRAKTEVQRYHTAGRMARHLAVLGGLSGGLHSTWYNFDRSLSARSVGWLFLIFGGFISWRILDLNRWESGA